MMIVGIWITGCKDKSPDKQDPSFIPVLSIIESQLKGIDTSVYAIIRLDYSGDSADTQYIRREDVRGMATDFLGTPVLTSARFEEENVPGPTEGLSTITYRPKSADKEEVQRIDVVLDPKLSETGQSVIKSIFIDRGISGRDSVIQKKLLWQVDRSFQVTTIRQLAGQKETVNSFRVIWNQD